MASSKNPFKLKHVIKTTFVRYAIPTPNGPFQLSMRHALPIWILGQSLALGVHLLYPYVAKITIVFMSFSNKNIMAYETICELTAL
jgi:hypothetical protein